MRTDQPPAMTVEEQAAAWFARQRRGALSSNDQHNWALWLAASPGHQRAYDAVSRTWTGLDALNGTPALAALRQQARKRHRWGMPATAIGLAAGLLLAWFARPLLQPRAHLYPQTAARIAAVDDAGGMRNDYRTAIGEERTITLADGSAITLDTDSAVRVSLRDNARLVRLVRGQAYFTVAKDPSRPFIVTAGDKKVMAVGTAFDVRLDDDAFSVTLREGRVRIEAPVPSASPPGAPSPGARDGGGAIRVEAADLVPGTKLQARRQTGWRLVKADVLRELSWLHRQVVFDSERLDSVIAEMNRYSTTKIILGDPALATLQVGGVFTVDNADQLTDALARYHLVRIASRTPGSIVLTSP